MTGVLPNIHIRRQEAAEKHTVKKPYLLHGVALVGVRSVLGIENKSGSPFNVQRSVHIPNLTKDEVAELFEWHTRESGQVVEQAVVNRLYYHLWGQPGLTCWFGELLTETFNPGLDKPIDIDTYRIAYSEALNVLPNANIVNLVSKARQETEIILKLFDTDQKQPFRFDNKTNNFLYLNGVIDVERSNGGQYIRFANPFVQQRLFNAFCDEYFDRLRRLHDPFDDLSDMITEDSLNVLTLVRRYETYLQKNHKLILRDVPRRKTDLRIYEAIYHFNFYRYLYDFLQDKRGQVIPEFPTGNGQIDLIIRHTDKEYGLELKSFANYTAYQEALKQAARYAKSMNFATIWLIFFVDAIDDANRQRLETIYQDGATNVEVQPVFVATNEEGQ